MDFKRNQIILGKDAGKLIMPSHHMLLSSLFEVNILSWVMHAAGPVLIFSLSSFSTSIGWDTVEHLP